jgi:Protein of unknown function (DUF3631)
MRRCSARSTRATPNPVLRADLQAVLNAGYRRGQLVLRMGGNNRTTLETFEVFGAKALAGLGGLPPTLASRCVRLELKRRRMSEPVQDFYPQDIAEEAGQLREGLAAWAEAALPMLKLAQPARVEGIRDRTMEVWRPLLAIAELDGETWSARARRGGNDTQRRRQRGTVNRATADRGHSCRL